jgi:hypothetical protein
VLHARLRKGSANTARGILRFVDELVARLRRAGATGELTLRAELLVAALVQNPQAVLVDRGFVPRCGAALWGAVR